MMKTLKSVAFLFLALSLSVSGYGQSEITGMPFLEIGSSSYSLAMGEATVALGNYPGSAHYNVASIGENNMVQLGSMFNFRDGFSLRRDALLGFGKPGISSFFASYKQNRWAYSLSLRHFKSTPGFSRRGQVPNPFEPVEYAINISTAYSFHFGLSVGLGLNVINSNLKESYIPIDGNEKINTVSLDLGALYRRSFDLGDEIRLKPSVGLSLSDFGPTINYLGQSYNQAMPMTLRSGIAATIETQREWQGRSFARLTIAGGLSKIMARRDEDGSPYGPLRALFRSWDTYYYPGFSTSIAGDAVYFPVSLKDQLNRHTGIELSFFEMAHFRFGRNHQSYINNGNSYTSFGGGLSLYYFQLDYSDINYDSLDHNISIWQLTGRIPLNSETLSYLTFHKN